MLWGFEKSISSSSSKIGKKKIFVSLFIFLFHLLSFLLCVKWCKSFAARRMFDHFLPFILNFFCVYSSYFLFPLVQSTLGMKSFFLKKKFWAYKKRKEQVLLCKKKNFWSRCTGSSIVLYHHTFLYFILDCIFIAEEPQCEKISFFSSCNCLRVSLWSLKFNLMEKNGKKLKFDCRRIFFVYLFFVYGQIHRKFPFIVKRNELKFFTLYTNVYVRSKQISRRFSNVIILREKYFVM